MKNEVKEKAKNFWDKNKAYIVGGCVNGAVCSVFIGLAFAKGYKSGFIDGGYMCFREGLKWLDEVFPGESNAIELYNRSLKEHPDMVVHRTGLGKWTK